MPSTPTRDLPEEFLAATRKSQEAAIRAIKAWVETVFGARRDPAVQRNVSCVASHDFDHKNTVVRIHGIPDLIDGFHRGVHRRIKPEEQPAKAAHKRASEKERIQPRSPFCSAASLEAYQR